jgi:hypothetical protein
MPLPVHGRRDASSPHAPFVAAAAEPGEPARLRRGRFPFVPLLLAAIAPVPVHAAVPSIPPGNEALVAEMLGKGAILPGECRLVSGSIEPTFIAARYECAGAPALLELRHRSEGEGAAARTARFAIVPRSAAPPALVDAVAGRVAGVEEGFRWTETAPATAPEPVPPPPAALEGEGFRGGVLAVVFLVAVLAAPLAVVGAVLWSYLAALCGLGDGNGFPPSDRRRLASYLGIFVAVVALGTVRVVPQWGMQLDEERDFILSALCAGGKGCPLYGNEMNQLRIKLGPLNRYLMTLCQLVTPDPRFTLSVILALHALGAAWLAASGDLLFGFPFGLVAGALFGANPTLLDTIAAASNGAWSPFFLVGAVVGTLRWVRGEPRGLLLAVTCLAVAVQLHGTNLVLLPPLALAALWWRPPLSGAVLALGALAVAALYSPWLLYQWESGGEDFSLVSTAWMVSEGPGLFERLGRVVVTLGGFVATLLALAGAIGLVAGGAAVPLQLAVGRTALLFLALPLGAGLLAGGNWVARYGVPGIVPGALTAAFGARVLARGPLGGIGARRARVAIGAVAFVWLAGIVIEVALAIARPSGFGAVEVRLGLAEQIEAIRHLGERGFRAPDLESRLHGAAWDRWDGGHAYLGKWLIGTGAGAAAGEHVVIVECEDVRGGGFASWQHRLAASSRRLPHLLVGYRAQLAPVRVELVGQRGVLWGRADGLPFYGQMIHGGDARLRAAFDPMLAYPPEFADLQIRWAEEPPSAMRLTTSLAPGREDRTLALVYDAGASAAVTIGGVRRRGIEAPAPVGGGVRERFRVGAAERSAALAIEIVIDLPAAAGVPRRIDLYEEPACDPAKDGSARLRGHPAARGSARAASTAATRA